MSLDIPTIEPPNAVTRGTEYYSLLRPRNFTGRRNFAWPFADPLFRGRAEASRREASPASDAWGGTGEDGVEVCFVPVEM